MAAKKAAAKTTALAKWDEKFAKYAKEGKEQLKNIATGGIGVRFGHGTITVAGNAIPGGKLECVIIGTAALNAWYIKAYNADEASAPDCYALANDVDDPAMAPHPQATSKQSPTCAECEKNQFGTASTGRGKACGNNLRLGLLTADDASDAEGAVTAELATAKISPTNRKAYKAYTDMLEEEHGRPVWAAVTEIQSFHDDKTQIRLEFKLVDPIEDDAILQALEKRYLKIRDEGTLLRPFAMIDKSAQKKAGSSAGKSKKFAAKKASKR